MPYASIDIHACAQSETWVILRVQAICYNFCDVYLAVCVWLKVHGTSVLAGSTPAV